MRTKIILRMVVCCLAFTLLFAFTGAIAADIEAAKREGKVIFYTSTDSKTAERIGDMFTEKYGIDVEIYRTGTGGVISKIEMELRAGKVAVDVVQHSDPTTFEDWKARNLLHGYSPEGIDKFHEFAVDPDGYWVALRSNLSVIAYNPNLVAKEDIPRSWRDALDPKWKGRLLMSSPGYAGSTRMWAAEVVKRYGWDYFRQLAKNNPYIGKSHSGLRTLLIAGEYDVISPMNIYHVFQTVYKEPESPIAVSYPEEGVLFIAGPAGIFKNSPYPNAAELFMDFLCSEEVQKVFADRAYYPGRKGVLPLAMPRLVDLKLLIPDYEWIGAHKQELIEKFDEIMGGK